jgi:fatty acid desaturase
VYGAWFLLVWYHALIPWWLMIPLGGYVIAWQFSLQHETIHGFRGVHAWFRFLIAFPPLGLWFPYPLYRKSHSIHHRNTYLTVPGVDTESYYVCQAEWSGASRIWKGILLANQTLAGRLLIGPLLRLSKLGMSEVARVRGGDYSHLRHWGVHVVAVGVLFWFVSYVAGMPWWQYVLLVAYPGMSLGLLRSFIEHRAGLRPGERTASIESNTLFGLLFLSITSTSCIFETDHALVRDSRLLSEEQGQNSRSQQPFRVPWLWRDRPAIYVPTRFSSSAPDPVARLRVFLRALR